MSTSAPTLEPTRQQARAASRSRSRKSHRRLAGYLTATAGCCGLATTADAEVVALDVTAFAGRPNAGLEPGGFTTLFTFGDGDIYFGVSNQYALGNGFNGILTGFYTNVEKDIRGAFAYSQGVGNENFIARFATNASIGSPASWTSEGYRFQFRYTYDLFGLKTWEAPDWGPGSFAGFRFGDDATGWNYGYIEATWDTATQTFEILSAAYETQLNTPILAGAVPVPEPGTATMAFGAVASLCLGGRAFTRWKKQRRREQPQEQPASVA